MSRLIVILGMHRSGTSCLTHALAAGGMHLGDELLEGTDVGNLEGHAEALEALAINDRILELSGGSWDRPPATLRSDAALGTRMERFLDGLRNHPVAGWKDPRTVLTFSLWKPRLHDYRVVGCLRHPQSVAKSLAAREAIPLDVGLGLWQTYNERLLAHLQAEQEFFLFDFDARPEELQSSTAAICRGLGLQTDASVQEVFNPFLRHQRCADAIADPRMRALYEELRDLARTRAANRPTAVPRAASQPTTAELTGQLRHLARAHELQNQVLQQIHERVKELEAHVVRLRSNPLYRAARALGRVMEMVSSPFRRKPQAPAAAPPFRQHRAAA
jgi:hypothetical protein